MNLNHDDRQRLWKALASYIEECRSLSEKIEEPELAEHYQAEADEAHELRTRIKRLS